MGGPIRVPASCIVLRETLCAGEKMSVDWDQLKQHEFDRVVEAIVLRRFGEGVRAVDGRGGDDGIDIEIVKGTQREILQLKCFPEGFSGGFKVTRRQQIKNSFETALTKQKPHVWTLVVPCVCTNEEDRFVRGLKGSRKVKISIVDRAKLDSWLAEDPNIDAYFQRTPINVLMQYAQVFNQETAALIDGYADIQKRIAALASVIDTVDPLWSYGIATGDGKSTITARPRPGVSLAETGIKVALKSGLTTDQTALLAAVEQDIGYGSGEPIRIPADMVDWVGIQGPALFDGKQLPAGDVEIRLTSRRPHPGQMIELNIEGVLGDEGADTDKYSYEGEVKHFDSGPLGSSLNIALCGGELVVKFRFPHVEDSEAHDGDPGQALGEVSTRLSYSIQNKRPAVVAEILGAARHIRTAAILELYIGDLRITKMGGNARISADQYGIDKLVIEQFAYDLDVVQRYCKKYFSMPQSISARDQIDIRVARILLDGGITASPKAQTFTAMLTGEDTPLIRGRLKNPWMLAMKAAEPYAVTINGKTLTIGPVWVTHPYATAKNGDAAIEALDAGMADHFAVDFRPGDDHYFLMALADRAFEDHLGKQISLWSLIDVEQPDADKMLEGWG